MNQIKTSKKNIVSNKVHTFAINCLIFVIYPCIDMDFFGFFSKDSKSKNRSELVDLHKRYEKTRKHANDSLYSLYTKKNEAVRNIEVIEKLLIKETNFEIKDIKNVADARASIRHYTETMLNTESAVKSNNDSTAKAVAISALASYVGGPIGVSLLFTGIVMNGVINTVATANKIFDYTTNSFDKMEEILKKLGPYISKVDKLITEIDDLNKRVSDKISELSKKHNDNGTKYDYTEIVDLITRLCNKINEKVNV